MPTHNIILTIVMFRAAGAHAITNRVVKDGFTMLTYTTEDFRVELPGKSSSFCEPVFVMKLNSDKSVFVNVGYVFIESSIVSKVDY